MRRTTCAAERPTRPRCIGAKSGSCLVQLPADCSEGHLIVSISCLQSAVHLATSLLSANLRYRACMLYFAMSSTRRVARLDCLDIISKCSSAAHFFVANLILGRCTGSFPHPLLLCADAHWRPILPAPCALLHVLRANTAALLRAQTNLVP